MRAAVVAVTLVGLLAAIEGGAAAADLEAHGWWWRAQTGLLAPLPPPPGAPEDGLVVSSAPDGPVAVAALRYEVDGAILAATLTLEVASEQGGTAAAISACPAAQRWLPAQAGTWDDRPPADCDAATVDGQRADDGSAWYFDVTSLVAQGVLDVVLEPQPGAPFQVSFAAPTSDSLEVTTLSEPEEFAAPPPPPGFEPPPDDFQPSTPIAPPPAFVPPPPAPAAPPDPVTASPDEPPQAGPAPAPAAPPELASTDTSTLGVLLFLAALAGFLLLGRQRPVAGVGGLGRFARPRTTPPPPLY